MLFFFNDTATTEIYTLSLHDALPICRRADGRGARGARRRLRPGVPPGPAGAGGRAADRGGLRVRPRSEEHTFELQSRQYLVCRLLLEKKKKTITVNDYQRDISTSATL